MSTQPLTTGRGLGAIGAFGAVLALTVVLWSLFGCAPKEAPDEQVANDQEQASDTSALDGQPVNWTTARLATPPRQNPQATLPAPKPSPTKPKASPVWNAIPKRKRLQPRTPT